MSASPNNPFETYLSNRWTQLSSSESLSSKRRLLKLVIADEFWNLIPEERVTIALSEVKSLDADSLAQLDGLSDPLDSQTVGIEFGLLVRTDFSNEDAWVRCLDGISAEERRLREFEEAMAMAGGDDNAAGGNDEDAEMDGADNGDEEEGEESEEEEVDEAPPIFKIINSTSPFDQAQLSNLSNLAVLRLLNDVFVLPSPPTPTPIASEKVRVDRTRTRLRSIDGWQEVYLGKRVWIYDSKSNTDGCLRVVEGRGASGGYTADSWRAKASHIPELQVNLSSGALQRIDFGGMDRWDWEERERNVREADAGVRA